MRSCTNALVCSARSSSSDQRDGPLAVGDIGAICAYINAPFYEMINESDVSVHSAKSLAHSRQIEQFPESSKTRPCLICRDDGPKGQTICLMATFDGVPIKQICDIYTHFMVPIWPTKRSIPPTDIKEHLHTTPAWANSPQWIIAFPYKLDKQVVTNRFTHPGCSSYHVDNASMNDFMDLCALKRREWAVKNVNVRRWQVKELRIPKNVFSNGGVINNATDEKTAGGDSSKYIA